MMKYQVSCILVQVISCLQEKKKFRVFILLLTSIILLVCMVFMLLLTSIILLVYTNSLESLGVDFPKHSSLLVGDKFSFAVSVISPREKGIYSVPPSTSKTWKRSLIHVHAPLALIFHSNLSRKHALLLFLIIPPQADSLPCRTGVSKLLPVAPLQPITCVSMACELRMVFTFF